VFVVLSLAVILFFWMGVPLYYHNFIESLDLEILNALRGLGMSNAFYAAYQTALVVLLAIGFWVAGGIIFRHKSDEWVALLVAFTLIGQGANAFEPLKIMENAPGFRIPVMLVESMVLTCLPLACYYFPDGRLPQRWLKYVAGVWFAWLLLSIFWSGLPINLFDREPRARLVFQLILLAVLGTGIYAQIRRYRKTDNAIKREQLKWVVFGVVVGILVGVGVNIFSILFGMTNPSVGARLIVDMATKTLSVIAQLTIPIAVVFSILRYRLYDIELIINRSLVIGILTVLLGLVFTGILFGMQAVFRAVTDNASPPPAAIVVATAVVVSVFNPTLRAARSFVNRKIFHIEFNFTEAQRRHDKLEKAARMPLHAVADIGGYTGLEMIARGGMGEIYKARHPSLNRTIAIKVLSLYFKEDADFNKRFAREAEMMAQLKHPNIINIYDYGEQDGLPYIVMEYLAGDTLSHILKERQRLSLDESLPLLRDLASALDFAHAQGIVHRDIKASNVMVEPVTTGTQGRAQRAILMDFGIARFTSERTRLTITGDMLGTADYISPEQIQGETDLDGKADQYSLAVLAFQMLTSRKPYARNNTWAMIRAHLDEPAPDPREIASMPDATALAIMKAMSKKPEDRFDTVTAFVEALGNL
jgi:tRNA A-37 threonylcarbamoyl transferase component Bud32